MKYLSHERKRDGNTLPALACRAAAMLHELLRWAVTLGGGAGTNRNKHCGGCGQGGLGHQQGTKFIVTVRQPSNSRDMDIAECVDSTLKRIGGGGTGL